MKKSALLGAAAALLLSGQASASYISTVTGSSPNPITALAKLAKQQWHGEVLLENAPKENQRATGVLRMA